MIDVDVIFFISFSHCPDAGSNVSAKIKIVSKRKKRDLDTPEWIFRPLTCEAGYKDSSL